MNILVTGASSGFGELIVNDLVLEGHRVAGTVRDPDGRNAEAAARLRAKGVAVIDLDVTDDASVEKGVAAARGAIGEVDVLVNNAGVGVLGLQENFTAADLQKVFDVNVYGLHRVTRAVLPAMRARASGLIVNISSLVGRVTLPFMGPYNATKWAVEALSENYRIELSRFGVDVAVIEPGGFPTAFFGNLLTPSSDERNAGYGEMANAPQAMVESLGETLGSIPEQTPQIVADAVLKVINTAPGQRPFRTEVDRSGMSEPIAAYNLEAEKVTQQIFAGFGMDAMLQLNTNAAKAA
ncbi:MAG: SDR family oxidoreductase [Pseudomonadota bacterium]